jgi:hypothetical protein
MRCCNTPPALTNASNEAADDGFLHAIRQKCDCPGTYLRGFPLFVPVLASIHH